MNTNKVYGIDLGTTYSAISYMNDDNKPEIINNSEGDPITASAVFFEPDTGNIVVGKTAKEEGKIDSDRVVTLIKREMGTAWRMDFDGKEHSPESISALILGYLVKGATEAGHEVKDVVITCPAYFGEKERAATKIAGELAGLNVLRIVDEPIAAAMNYGVTADSSEAKQVIVYDLGGGTFDVTVVHVSKDGVEVLCTDGDHKLGGADWDERLMNLIAQKFVEACPAAGDPLEDVESRFELMTKTEEAKMNLTTKSKANIAVSHNGERARITVTREEFESATRDLLESTVSFTDKMIALGREKSGVEKIDEFLLVGGSTYMPQVRAIVEEKYKEALGVEPKIFEPNYAVSKGAAVFGNTVKIQEAVQEKIEEIKQETGSDVNPDEAEQQAIAAVAEDFGLEVGTVNDINSATMKTVASKSYGIRVLNKDGQRVCFNLIKRQTQVPCSISQKFPVSEANASSLPLVVYSNNSMEATEVLEYCMETGDAVMELTPGLAKGAPIEVTFTLNEEGQLQLTARDLTNDKEITVSFEVRDGLTQEEIEEKRQIVADLVFAD